MQAEAAGEDMSSGFVHSTASGRPRQGPTAGPRALGLATACAGAVGALALLAAKGLPELWPAELVISLAPQAALVAGSALLLSAFFRSFGLAVGGLELAAAAALALLDGIPPAPAAPSEGGATIVWANVYGSGRAAASVLDIAIEADADFLALAEAPENDSAALALARAAFPYEAAPKRETGVILLSRTPLSDARATSYRYKRSVAARAEIGGAPIDLVAVHLPTPTSPGGQFWRRRFWEETAALLRPGAPTVLVGDFNATPWSPLVRERIGGLGFARASIGASPTWLSRLPGVGLPIDHAFVSGGLTASARVASRVASDHYPLVVRIGARDALPNPAAPATEQQGRQGRQSP